MDENTSPAAGSDEHRRAWFQDAMVDKFADKRSDDFFRSETTFLSRIGGDVHSVLDVGCASGRLLEVLDQHLEPGYTFTGVDLVPESIERARARYPAHDFVLGDVLEMGPQGRFDLVNATGVVQHEPRFESLVDTMLRHSRRWVLFDAKVASLEHDVVDRERAFVTIGDDRLYFNVLAFTGFIERLRAHPLVGSVDVVAYETPTNPRTTIEPDIAPIASAGFLLAVAADVAAADTPVHADVPAFLSR